MSAYLYLTRHAQPDWERKDIPYHLPPGPPLTAQGLAEARALGAYLKAQGVCKIYASPLERALHTAHIACEILSESGQSIQPIVLDALIEWQPGESTEQVAARLWPVIETASQESLVLGPVAVVTHGGPIGAVLARMGLASNDLETYKRQFDHGNAIPTAGAWQALCNGHGWQLELVFKPEITLA